MLTAVNRIIILRASNHALFESNKRKTSKGSKMKNELVMVQLVDKPIQLH